MKEIDQSLSMLHFLFWYKKWISFSTLMETLWSPFKFSPSPSRHQRRHVYSHKNQWSEFFNFEKKKKKSNEIKSIIWIFNQKPMNVNWLAWKEPNLGIGGGRQINWKLATLATTWLDCHLFEMVFSVGRIRIRKRGVAQGVRGRVYCWFRVIIQCTDNNAKWWTIQAEQNSSWLVFFPDF
jgi:hypothetical protein